MKFEFRTSSGDYLGEAEFDDVDMAISDAKTRLEDEPELGAVEVHELVMAPVWVYRGKATGMPGPDWDTEIGWLWPGERVVPPAGDGGPFDTERGKHELEAEAEDEAWALDPSDPKHPTYYERMVGDA